MFGFHCYGKKYKYHVMKKLVVGITSPISVILIKGQLRHFSNRGYKVYLLAPQHPDVRQLCEEENAIHLPVNFKREIAIIHDVWGLAKVIYYLIKVSPQIVNIGTPKASLLGIIAAKLLGIRKRVYTCRGFRFEHEKGLKRRILVMMEKLTGYLATDIICISASIRSMAIQESIFKDVKCKVIGQGSSNGIDLTCFNRSRVNWDLNESDRQHFGINGRFVFGFVGRLIDRKGVRELVMAFTRLRSKYSDIVLLMVGHAEFDQLTDKEVIDEIRNNGDIISVGWQTDVARYLSMMDVFVLPAWWEGFGNVLIQAAAMGIPVISTHATGTRDAVKDGFNGILVNPRSVEELANGMERYYKDPKIRELHGGNGLAWSKNFESVAIWSGIEKMYNQ